MQGHNRPSREGLLAGLRSSYSELLSTNGWWPLYLPLRLLKRSRQILESRYQGTIMTYAHDAV